MKKPLSYNLTDDNHKAAKAAGKELGWSRSLWLDKHLTEFFNKDLEPLPESLIPRQMTVKPKPNNEEFEMVWRIYEKKGNKKTSLAKFNKLSADQKALMADHILPYVNSTPDKQFRKNLETYINQECWNDEVMQNGQSREKTFETSSDRYAEQSKRLQERERIALGHNKDSAFIQIDG